MNPSKLPSQASLPECEAKSSESTCAVQTVRLPALTLFIASTDPLFIDAGVKWLVSQNTVGTVFCRTPPILEFIHTENSGIAYGMLSQTQFAVFGIMLNVPLFISGVLLLLLLFLALRFGLKKNVTAVAFGLILGGGLNNFLDRLLTGSVTDYIHLLFVDFPVFNLSDACISIGCFLLILYILKDPTHFFSNAEASKL